MLMIQICTLQVQLKKFVGKKRAHEGLQWENTVRGSKLPIPTPTIIQVKPTNLNHHITTTRTRICILLVLGSTHPLLFCCYRLCLAQLKLV